MKSIVKLLLAACLILGSTGIYADVLLLDAIAQNPTNNPEGIPRPTNGQTMEQVKKTFGEPLKELPAVGNPPITRWDYDRYSVYFEYDRVITSVVHRTAPESETPEDPSQN